jgi:NAD(P)H dehydrogenase (quinone)
MAIPLLHHGMLYVGLPYSIEELSTTTTGGSLYGATHVTWNQNPDKLSDDEKRLAYALGRRVAEIGGKLAS